jgi:hypothetical protein
MKEFDLSIDELEALCEKIYLMLCIKRSMSSIVMMASSENKPVF